MQLGVDRIEAIFCETRREGAHVRSAVGLPPWFDGFWDFLLRERDGVAEWPSVCIADAAMMPSGLVTAMALMALVPPEVGHVRLHGFLESKARHAVAPWPVQTIQVGSGRAVAQGSADAARRAAEPERSALETIGFQVEVGYWGPSIHAVGEAAEAFLACGAAAVSEAMDGLAALGAALERAEGRGAG